MEKLKHLEICQNVIARMASNSFFLKGWSVTLVTGLFALAAHQTHRNFVFVALFPVVVFWLLDSYFLRQERLFRELYDSVRQKNNAQIDFTMDASSFENAVHTMGRTLFSVSEFPFYGALLGVIGLVLFLF